MSEEVLELLGPIMIRIQVTWPRPLIQVESRYRDRADAVYLVFLPVFAEPVGESIALRYASAFFFLIVSKAIPSLICPQPRLLFIFFATP